MEYDLPMPRVIISARRNHQNLDMDKHLIPSFWQLDRKMATLVRHQTKATYISAFEDMCALPKDTGSKESGDSPSNCLVFAAPDIPIIWDNNHFTAQGSILYANVMRDRSQLP
jgi:hypothetical protein